MEEKSGEFSIDLDFKKKKGQLFNTSVDDAFMLPDTDDEDSVR